MLRQTRELATATCELDERLAQTRAALDAAKVGASPACVRSLRHAIDSVPAQRELLLNKFMAAFAPGTLFGAVMEQLELAEQCKNAQNPQEAQLA